MNRQVKATHFSLLVHALFLWGALQLSQPPQAPRPPIALDFSILAAGGPAASRQPEAAAESKPVPPPAPPVEKKVSKPVVKKTAPPQAIPKKTAPPAEEKTSPTETVPVAASPAAAASGDSAQAAETTAPTTAQAPGTGQGHGGGGGIFSVGQLDGPLAVLAKSPPVYPSAAKRRNIEGWIKIKFVVDEHGHVGHVSVLAAEPEGVFEQSVLQCVGTWRFKPGTIKGMAVKAQVEQTITFRLEG